MPHPHGQIYSFPYIPPFIQTELDSAANYFRGRSVCLYCDILAGEKKDGRRIVWENASFTALCPFYARYPTEVAIYARRHMGALPDLTDAEAMDLAEIIKIVRMK